MHTDRLTSILLDYGTGHAAGTCSTQMVFYQHLQIFGTTGRIELPIPFNAPPDRPSRIIVDTGADLFGGGISHIDVDVCNQYTIQGDLFSKAILENTAVPSPLEDAVKNMACIDAIFKSADNRTLGGTAVAVSIYLGLDSSTQSVTATAVEIDDAHPDRRAILFERSFRYDETLPHYGTEHGVLRSADPRTVHAPPLMWSEALDRMVADLLRDIDVDWSRLRAISGSAQQHGSVYVNASAHQRLGALDPSHAARRSARRRVLTTHVADLDGFEHDQPVRRHRGRGRGAARARPHHRIARVRALHGAADPEVRRGRPRRLCRDRSRPPRQLVAGVPARRIRMRQSIRATVPA